MFSKFIWADYNILIWSTSLLYNLLLEFIHEALVTNIITLYPIRERQTVDISNKHVDFLAYVPYRFF